MRIEELTDCFDSVTPTKEQKEKILAGIMAAKEKPVKVVRLNRYKFVSIAAVVAVGVFVAVYSNLGKNVGPVVHTPQTTEGNSTSTYAVNINQKSDEQNKLSDNQVNLNTETENVHPVEQIPTTSEESLSEELNKAYPELEDEFTEDYPMVAMLNPEENTRIVPAPSEPADSDNVENVPEESDPVNDEEKYGGTYSAGGGGGGGSASGGGSAAGAYKSLTITEVMNHSIYSQFMPVVYTDKFNFYNAIEYTNRLKVVFKNDIGNYMSVSVFKDGDYNFYEQVLTPEEIKNIKSDGYMNFAVKCEDYYIVYNVETNNSSAVYDMVISSAYFNN